MDITYRLGTPEDSRTVFYLMSRTWADLARRTGTPDNENLHLDPAWVASLWDRSQAAFTYLSTCADRYWVAEHEGQIVGFARSTFDDGVRELTEIFVLPTCQSAGIGRALLERAFPAAGARRRVILASTDIRAQALYLKAGVYPRFANQHLARKPEPVRTQTDLQFVPMTASPQTLAALRMIDKLVLGFERDAKHEHLFRDRKAYLYLRGDQVVGYGYIGNNIGPVALLHESDYPAVLAHAENDAAIGGEDSLMVYVPLINRAAVDHLLARKFQLVSGTTMLFMSDEPFGRFENYMLSNPPVFL